MKRPYTFLLNFGYAESGGLSFLPWTSRVTFSTAREALVDLATYLRDVYVSKSVREPRACCVGSREKDPGAQFCHKCGRVLAEVEFDPEAFMQWVSEIGVCDTDTFHGDYIEWDDEARWEAGVLEGALVKGGGGARIVYTAEKVLAAAIGHSPDERVTIESIFEARTKSGSSHFSFW
jgi:hypothetical protein